MEEECSVETKDIKESEGKRIRRRRKKIHQMILRQMEFYFSDANLTKDRYLSKLIENDPYVDLSVFLKFNKIRTLTNSVDELASVLNKSEFLVLSEDRTKVCRPTPVNRNYIEDDCSVYVQNLPPNAKHEWLQDIFSVYGKVVYVSLPKYKQNGKLKGFGFVEFESPEAANKALEAFNAAGCCLPMDMAPEQLCSVATFEPGDNKKQVGMLVNQGEGEMNEMESNSQGSDVKHEAGEEDQPGNWVQDDEGSSAKPEGAAENVSPLAKERKKKRKKKSEDIEDDAENEEDVEVKLEHSETEKCSSPVSKKKKKLKKEEGEEEEQPLVGGRAVEEKDTEPCVLEESSSTGSKEKKKKRKREEGNEDDAQVEEAVEAEEEEESAGAQTLEDESLAQKEKKKGKRKKEEVEEEEKEEDEEQAKRIRLDEGAEDAEEEETAEDALGVKKKRKKRNRAKSGKLEEESLGLRVLSKRDWKRLRNKYLNLQRKNMRALRTQMMGRRWCDYWCDNEGHQNMDMDHERDWHDPEEKEAEYPMEDPANNGEPSAAKSKPRIQYSPGVIVKVQFKEPLESAKKFKDEVRNLPKSDSVAYVDVKDASSVAHIRCQTSEAAIDFLKDVPWENRKILEGNEEQEYWNKILEDRHEKITKKIRVNQRGRDKILKKAENFMGKHVRYEN